MVIESNSRVWLWATIGIAVAINVIVAVNALRHDYKVQYDRKAHEICMRCYARGRFPTREDTHEFFSAPLPYLVPELICRTERWSLGHAQKAGQALNVVASIGACLCLAWGLRQATGSFRAAVPALLLMGMVPAYYRTMAFVRGEPLIVFFGLVAALLALRMFQQHHTGWGHRVGLGLAMGLVALSRQWGVMILLALGAFAAVCLARSAGHRKQIFLAGLTSLAIGIATSGWFYLHLINASGSVTAFNMEQQPSFSLSNRPAGFFSGTGNGKLFTQPFRGAFDHHLFPVFHADAWGDYWGYFLMKGWDVRNGDHFHGYGVKRILGGGRPDWLATNYERMGRYLGRVNRVALLPTALFLAACVWALWRGGTYVVGRSGNAADAWLLVSVLSVVFSIALFLWYLLMYRTSDPGCVKASYMLQILPFLAIPAGLLAERLAARSRRAYYVLLALLAAIWLHNLPAYFSRFTLMV